jgi:hypothetical protein
VLFATRALLICQAKVFMGSCKQAQCFAVIEPFLAQRCQLFVCAPQCPAAGERKAF